PAPTALADPARRRALLFAFGSAVFALAWLPSLLIASQPVEPRICYPPALGAALAFIAAADFLRVAALRRPAASRAWTAATALVLAVALPAGALCMLGIQSALRD